MTWGSNILIHNISLETIREISSNLIILESFSRLAVCNDVVSSDFVNVFNV